LSLGPAPVAFRFVFSTIVLVNLKDCLSHEESATVGLAHGQAEHAANSTGSAIHGLAQPPAAQFLARLSAAADVSPEPVEELGRFVGGRRVAKQQRVPL